MGGGEREGREMSESELISFTCEIFQNSIGFLVNLAKPVLSLLYD